MGWDHHSALDASLRHEQETGSTPTSGPGSSLLEPSLRRDNNSLHEIFTIPQLVAAFSLEHVNHRKAAVNLSKLDFINKMTLRRKAGRLGEDGVMIDRGKEGLMLPGDAALAEDAEEGAAEEVVRKERAELVKRVQGYLKAQEVLKEK